MTDTIKDVMETLIEYANGGVSGLYPPEDDIQELVDYILDLQEEIERLTISLQAQEELTMNEHIKVEKLRSIIKEVREYIENNQTPISEPSTTLMKLYGRCLFEGHIKDILEILDKE